MKRDLKLQCEWLLGDRRPSLEDMDTGLDPKGPMYNAITSNPAIRLSLSSPKMLLGVFVQCKCKNLGRILVFRLSPCFWCRVSSSGYIPGVSHGFHYQIGTHLPHPVPTFLLAHILASFSPVAVYSLSPNILNIHSYASRLGRWNWYQVPKCRLT
jgi:hypothetical protein